MHLSLKTQAQEANSLAPGLIGWAGGSRSQRGASAYLLGSWVGFPSPQRPEGRPPPGTPPRHPGTPPWPTSSLVHLHAPQLVLPGAQLAVHLLVTVVAVLVLLQCLLPQQLHVLHRALVLHDHVVHLLHLWAAHTSERGPPHIPCMMGAPSPSPGQAQQRGLEQVFRKALNLVRGHALGFLNLCCEQGGPLSSFPQRLA